ncbi:TPA: hypothetical protein HA242_04580 [Candidatus Woesearchaeota archaeon]|nr:hypothetical protein [Candidatus Woesearchaeota archaeon]HIG93716.1 hypothetical protein [Candidatus Woesearchaeota archaeon]HIH12974.1 hypothetical protein [Candidatus Woesearchaeota archaeon]
MYRLFLTPVWFNGWDLVFEAVGLVVALLIAAYSWRMYRLNVENRFAYFSLAFILVAVGLAAKMITSSILYFTPVRDVAAVVLGPVAGSHLRFSGLLYRGGFFLQMVATLGAWLLIYFISQKARERLKRFDELTQLALFIYLVLLISVVANFNYFVFYLTSTVLLGLIVLNYYRAYLNKKNKNTWRVMLAFMCILLSSIFYVFVFWFEHFYVVGEVLLLAGFLVLLYTYSSLMRKK